MLNVLYSGVESRGSYPLVAYRRLNPTVAAGHGEGRGRKLLLQPTDGSRLRQHPVLVGRQAPPWPGANTVRRWFQTRESLEGTDVPDDFIMASGGSGRANLKAAEPRGADRGPATLPATQRVIGELWFLFPSKKPSV